MTAPTEERIDRKNDVMLATKHPKYLKKDPATIFTYLAGCAAFGNMIGGVFFGSTVGVAACAILGLIVGIILYLKLGY